MSIFLKSTIQTAKDKYSLDINGIHGLGHWERVLTNGLKLASLNGADPLVIEYFAYLHDCCRMNEGIDAEHGKRAAEFARTIREDLKLTDHQFSLLYEACRNHNHGHTLADITVMTCWDADRLDLKRVHIQPLPDGLCTPEAKCQEMISWASGRAEKWRECPPAIY